MFLLGMRAARMLVMLTLVFSVAQVKASVIGSWNGSSESWNTAEFTTIKATMINAGHTVEPDGAITAANLADDCIFLIQEPSRTPSASELSDLDAWVNNGGLLIIQTDTSAGGRPSCNAILSAIGSSISIGSGGHANAPLSGGICATEGPPYDIVGQTLATSPGFGVAGGNALAGTYARYEVIGGGCVFVFGNRPDHNAFVPTSANVNGQLFLNLGACCEKTITLSLDIKPGSCPNPLNTNTQGKGRLPMAILGTSSFDVNDIDPLSIKIEEVIFPLKTPSIEDVATPLLDGEECECHELEGDGFTDLVIHFSRAKIITTLSLGDMPRDAEVPITVTGKLFDGTPFEATDCVRIIARED
jgi:hypothetical protein